MKDLLSKDVSEFDAFNLMQDAEHIRSMIGDDDNNPVPFECVCVGAVFRDSIDKDGVCKPAAYFFTKDGKCYFGNAKSFVKIINDVVTFAEKQITSGGVNLTLTTTAIGKDKKKRIWKASLK